MVRFARPGRAAASNMGLALVLHLALSATPAGPHLLEGQLTPPPVLSLDDAGDGVALSELPARIKALNTRIQKLGPNIPVAPTVVLGLCLLGGYEGLLPIILATTSPLLPIIYFTVVVVVVALAALWAYTSWSSKTEERAALIKERDALQRRLDAVPSPLQTPILSVERDAPVPSLVLARF